MIKKVKEIIIRSKEQFEKIIRERRDKAKRKIVNEDMLQEDPAKAQHLACANQLLKLIGCMKIDPIMKKVMTMRLLGPLMTGVEKSYLSIGLELGISEAEVKQIDMAGLEIVEGYLQKYSGQEFIDKFNMEKKINLIIANG